MVSVYMQRVEQSRIDEEALEARTDAWSKAFLLFAAWLHAPNCDVLSYVHSLAEFLWPTTIFHV